MMRTWNPGDRVKDMMILSGDTWLTSCIWFTFRVWLMINRMSCNRHPAQGLGMIIDHCVIVDSKITLSFCIFRLLRDHSMAINPVIIHNRTTIMNPSGLGGLIIVFHIGIVNNFSIGIVSNSSPSNNSNTTHISTRITESLEVLWDHPSIR